VKDVIPNTVDFETEAINSRPVYPPKPVGVAIRRQDGSKKYWSWGHPEGNNCTMAEAGAELRQVYADTAPPLFHNGAFDLDVAETYFGLRPPANFEDTLFLSFLSNPHEPTIALKPLSEKYLGMPPEEQNDLEDWIRANVRKENGKKLGKKEKDWGAYICKAPASIVGPYAIGDVDRTIKLWKKFRPEIHKRSMDKAYEREVKLVPITLEMERSGIRVDVPGLKKALRVFTALDNDLVEAIHGKLRGDKDKGSYVLPEDFNVDSGPQLAKALLEAGKLSSIVKTKTGRQSTKVSVLHETCNDKQLLNYLAVHSVAHKYITGFLQPWIEQAEVADGRILPKFNQVRARDGQGGGGGTRTGRYSSSDPNLQTVTANVDESKNKDVLLLMQKWLRNQYSYEFIGLRDFFLPDEGCLICSVDYNQQELRLLAHFEEGLLAEAYRTNPKLDIHAYLQGLIKEITGIEYPRKSIKILVFGIVYGMGVNKLSVGIGESYEVAKKIRDALFKAVPGIRKLMDELKKLEISNRPLRTWGGREYFCEPPITIEVGEGFRKHKKTIHFGYKMLNALIQPSAADVTKQGMLNVREQVPEARIAIQVHDELVCMIPNLSCGSRIAKAMCDMEFSVPMTADAKYSDKSWARVTEKTDGFGRW
jgi:DNA polymerase I